MPQHDLIIDNGSGAGVRADLNNALAALGSTMKGPNAPPAPLAGMMWLDDDTPSATVWTLRFYDGAEWISIGTFDIINNSFSLAPGILNATGATFTGDLALSDDDGVINFNNAAITTRGGYLRNLVASMAFQVIADQYKMQIGTLTAKDLEFLVNNAIVARFGATGGLVLGGATGGDLGGGVLNATGVRVNNVPLMPAPQASGVGQFSHFNSGAGNAVVLPAGGTWTWFLQRFSSSGVFDAVSSSVATAGGTTIMAAAAGFYGVGWWWRK